MDPNLIFNSINTGFEIRFATVKNPTSKAINTASYTLIEDIKLGDYEISFIEYTGLDLLNGILYGTCPINSVHMNRMARKHIEDVLAALAFKGLIIDWVRNCRALMDYYVGGNIMRREFVHGVISDTIINMDMTTLEGLMPQFMMNFGNTRAAKLALKASEPGYVPIILGPIKRNVK